jgi:hypothetical protein
MGIIDMSYVPQSKQEQCYVDLISLIAQIAKDSFGVDLVNNPLFSGVFKQQLEANHQKIVGFIIKYVPVEPPPVVNPPINMVNQQVHQPQPVFSATPPETEINLSPSRVG